MNNLYEQCVQHEIDADTISYLADSNITTLSQLRRFSEDDFQKLKQKSMYGPYARFSYFVKKLQKDYGISSELEVWCDRLFFRTSVYQILTNELKFSSVEEILSFQNDSEELEKIIKTCEMNFGEQQRFKYAVLMVRIIIIAIIR
jgi:hypothetical protein